MTATSSRPGMDGSIEGAGAGLAEVAELAGRIATNIQRVIVGKPEVVRIALVTLLAEGHLLVEDVPGVGKTSLAEGAGPLDRLLGQPRPVHARPAAR